LANIHKPDKITLTIVVSQKSSKGNHLKMLQIAKQGFGNCKAGLWKSRYKKQIPRTDLASPLKK
jgi:hypothetical protein